MMRDRRTIGRMVAVLSAIAVAAAIAEARLSELLIVAILIVAMAWGATPQAIDAFFGQWTPPVHLQSTKGSITVVIHVQGEPTEVSQASVQAAAAIVPTIVVATDVRAVEALGPLTVPMIVESTIAEAVNRAATMIETDAIFMLSARSFADAPSCELAAGLIREGAGWVVGRSRTFNRDGFAPLVRGRLGNRLRSSARGAGLHLWETDATIVSTRLVRELPFEPGRPFGATLRTWAAHGATAVEQDMTLAMTAEPADARSYWPVSVAHGRGVVADLADAAITGRGRARWLAIGLLLRELGGYPLTIWLLTPWLITRTAEFPFRCSPWLIGVLTIIPALLRWVAARHAHGIRVHPMEDILALAFEAPASVLALPAVVTRRVAPTRWALPGQPMVLAGLVFAAITIVPLFSTGTTARRSTAVGLAVTELAFLWLFAMRAVFQHNWARTGYRVSAHLPTRVDHTPSTTIDVSPTGLAVAGHFESISIGSDVPIEISLDDGATLCAHGTVIDRGPRGDRDVVGLSLIVSNADRSQWIAQLSRSATASTNHVVPTRGIPHTAPPRNESFARRVLDVIVVTVITAFSLTAVTALCLAIVGYEPLIVRSGSMEPILHAGDVVVVEDVEARQLVVGDVATFPNPAQSNDTLTHRVRALTDNGVMLTLTTRGDANLGDETTTMEPRAIVGRVVWRLPFIGRSLAWAGSTGVRWTAGVVGGFVAAVAFARRHRRRARAPAR